MLISAVECSVTVHAVPTISIYVGRDLPYRRCHIRCTCLVLKPVIMNDDEITVKIQLRPNNVFCSQELPLSVCQNLRPPRPHALAPTASDRRGLPGLQAD